MEESACLVMKNIGKPCTGKPYARFDEGEQASVAMVRLLRHRQTKGGATARSDLRGCDACFLLYPLSSCFAAKKKPARRPAVFGGRNKVSCNKRRDLPT